jgi:hypothetical protein
MGMMKRILIVALFTGCVAEDPGREMIEPPPEQPLPPTPLSVDIDWDHTIDSGGDFDVKEVSVKPISFGGGKAVVQLSLRGYVTGISGQTMKLQINHGTGSWEYAGLKSSDYTSGSCGSWQMGQNLLFGHTCTAPGQSDVADTTTWSYHTAELFEIDGTPEAYSYTGAFHIRILDGAREIQCRELELKVTRNELDAGSSFSNGPCS